MNSKMKELVSYVKICDPSVSHSINKLFDDMFQLGMIMRGWNKETDYPMAVGIWANKYDIWGEKYPLSEGRTIDKHEIFEPFKYGMRQLNDKGIPCFKYLVSAKSDPEMVYRVVMTMIKDY